MTFAKHLKHLMVERGLNQAQLATCSELSKASISQLLSGKQAPSEKALIKLAQAMECTVDDLVHFSAQEVKETKLYNLNMPVEEAAKRLGKSVQFVRIALQRGLAPFGFATRITGNKFSYHISPKLFEEYQGGTPCITTTQETHTGLPNPVIS